ncbi:MAG: glycosyltransferase family 4 protein [Flavobacterium sp.]
MKPKLVRITTVPISMNILLKGQLAFMNRHFEVIGVTGKDEKHFKEAGERESIRMVPITMQRAISPVKDLISLYRLYAFMRKEKPAIVHTHTPKAGLLGMAAAWMARVPVRLHTVAGLPLVETSGFKRKLLSFIEKITYKMAHEVYPNSYGLEEIILKERFCGRDKMKVIANGSSNGINTAHFSTDFIEGDKQEYREKFRAELGILPGDVVYGFVGRLSSEKGIAELVHAFLKLQKQPGGDKAKLLLIGPMEKDTGILSDEVIKSIGETPGILAVGRHDDIRPYLFASDVFAFPSYREGFPNVVLQAGALGLPCIVSNINGSNEIITHNENGLIVPVKNTEQLFEAMQLLLNDRILREKLASKARETVVSRFENHIVWEAILAEYKKHLNQA